MLTREHLPGTAKPCRNFIKNQQRASLPREFGDPAEEANRMRAHSSRALHQRLDHQRGKLFAISFDQFRSRPQRAFVGLIRIHPPIESVRMGWIDLERREQHRTYMAMKMLAVSQADRAHRIAVISLGQCEKKFAPSMAAQLP